MLYQTEREVEVGFANFCGGLYNNGFPEARKSLSLEREVSGEIT
jgi:hypothetical protein